MSLVRFPCFVLASLCAFLLIASSASGAIISGEVSDIELNSNNTFGMVGAAGGRAGSSNSNPGGGRNMILVFKLPSDLGAGSFSTVDFQMNMTAKAGSFSYNADLYALGTQSIGTLTLGSGALSLTPYYDSSLDASATLIQNNMLVPSTAVGLVHTDTGGDSALTSYLNTIYNNGAGAGLYVVFRLNADAAGSNQVIGYTLNFADAGGAAVPALTYTFTPVPEPGAAWSFLVAGLSGVFLRRRPGRR